MGDLLGQQAERQLDHEASFFNRHTPAPPAWDLPPANLGTAEDLFDQFPVYDRPAAMLEGYRQIVGDTAFFAFQKALVTEHEHSTITGDQFVALAKRIAAEKAGFAGSNLTKLDTYFQQWLYGTVKPTMNPTTFFQSTSVPGDVSGTVPADAVADGQPAGHLRHLHAGRRPRLHHDPRRERDLHGRRRDAVGHRPEHHRPRPARQRRVRARAATADRVSPRRRSRRSPAAR